MAKRGRKPGCTKTGGRKKGTPNKFHISVKESVIETFKNLGGVEHMTEWAQENPTEFYRICSRLIPTQTEVSGTKDAPPVQVENTHRVDLSGLSPEEQRFLERIFFKNTPGGK